MNDPAIEEYRVAPNEPRPTKAQRREAARAKAKALREAEERRAKRNAITRRSLIGVGSVAVVGGALLPLIFPTIPFL